MSQVMKANIAQVIFPQDELEMLCYIVRLIGYAIFFLFKLPFLLSAGPAPPGQNHCVPQHRSRWEHEDC